MDELGKMTSTRPLGPWISMAQIIAPLPLESLDVVAIAVLRYPRPEVLY